MAKRPHPNDSRRSFRRRNASNRLALFPLTPWLDSLETRRLLTIAINEFGGTASLANPAGITSGPDGDLWFTLSNSSNPAIGQISPSGAINLYSFGLSTNSDPNGITAGPGDTLWFTDPGSNQIGEITTSGTIIEYNLPTTNSNPDQIALGSDGALWFTMPGIDAIGRITTAGAISQATIPTVGGDPTGITAGPDGALWFTESGSSEIGRITTGGAFSEFSTGITPSSDPVGITAGPDGNLWFTQNTADQIGRITTSGVITEFSNGLTAGAGPLSITTGSNSALWFTEQYDNKVGEITTSGSVTEYSGPGASTASLDGIASGSDGNLWFTENAGNFVDRITTAGVSTQFPSPTNVLSTNSDPSAITTGPDGALWFTESGTGQIGRISTSAVVSEYPTGILSSTPNGITLGPVPQGGGAANLWFTDDGGITGGEIAEINAQGQIFGQFPIPTSGSLPAGITLGPDGNLWFAESGSSTGTMGIGKITPTGTITEFRTGLTSGFSPVDIVTGPDGNLWFTADSTNGGEIGRISTNGTITEFPVPGLNGSDSSPQGIVAGTGNTLWFTDAGNHSIGEITIGGQITEFTQGLTPNDVPTQITLGADGNYWFTDPAEADPVGRITPQGIITLYQAPNNFASEQGITAGPDHNIWFTEAYANQIGQVVLTNSINNITATPATVYATVPSTFQLATFTDQSTATNAANFSATIDYGDGVSGPATILPVNGTPGEYQILGTHTYASVNAFTTTITISTGTGSLAPITTSVTANNPIELFGNTVQGQVGTRSNTFVGDFTDQDSTAIPSDFTATVSWDDGSPDSTATIIGSATPLNFNLFAGHVYTTSGTFSGTLMVVDNRNGLSLEFPFTAVIAAAPTQSAFNEVGPDSLSPGSEPTSIVLAPDGYLWFTEPNSGKIGKVTTSGDVTEFGPVSTNPLAQPDQIASGPDGNLWFTEPAVNAIGQITTSGVITNFSAGITAGSDPTGITGGPNGNIWFTEQSANQIGKITPNGTVTEFSTGLPAGFDPDAITLGPDGNLWFVGTGSNEIGRISPQGIITVYTGATGSNLTSITTGPDDNLWFTEKGSNQIGKINPATFVVVEYQGTAISSPTSIVDGPDNNLWFTEQGANAIGRITTTGVSIQISTGLTLDSDLQGIADGLDNNIYFAEACGDRIGQVVLPQSSLADVAFSPPNTGQGRTISGNFGTFYERSTIPTSLNFATEINWGDGSPIEMEPSYGGPNLFSSNASHTFLEYGTFNGSYTVYNDAGSETEDFTIQVVPAITVTGINVTTQAGRTINQAVAMFTDQSGQSSTNSYVDTINWGDGTTTTGTIANDATGFVFGSHTYATAGNYTVTTTVQISGQPTFVATGTSTAIVNPFFSVLKATGTEIYQTKGSPFSGQVATFTDSSTSEGQFTATIDWGDGSLASSGQVQSIFGGYEVLGSHDYATTGPYAVTVLIQLVNQPDTATATSSALVEVAGPIDEVKSGITGTPSDITSGPNETLWFTEPGLNAVAEITTGGVVTEFTNGITSGSQPTGIVEGPDGNLWFTQPGTNQIGRITPSGVVTEFSGGTAAGQPLGITDGPDGNLWFTDSNGPNGYGAIGRITTSGVVTQFRQGLNSGATPVGIATGPDGNLWFTDQNLFSPAANAIGRITPQGIITLFNVPTASLQLSSITAGPDGALWFTEDSPGAIGRITTTGVVTQSSTGLSAISEPQGITNGPDNNLWFVDTTTNHADRLTTADIITPFAIPTSNSQPGDIITGPDQNLWFTETASNQIGQVVTPESVTSTSIPQTVLGSQPTTIATVTYRDNSSLVDLPRFFSTFIAFGDGTDSGTGVLVPDGTDGYTLEAEHTYVYVPPGLVEGSTTLTDALGTTPPTPFQIIVNQPVQLSFVVINTNDSGPGSLRQAILDADQVGGHRITFAIPALGVVTIDLLSPLPTIESTSSIDGTSQSLYEAQSGQAAATTTPLVEINGQSVGGTYAGLVFAGNAGNAVVSDLSIYGFGGAQIELDSPGDLVWGNYIGLRADGSVPLPLSNEQARSTTIGTPAPDLNANGILIQAADAIIGGLGPAQGNVISANGGQGIEISGSQAASVGIFGNLIGLDPTGSVGLGNGVNGIAVLNGAGHEFIGPSNVISGNAGDGIVLLGSGFDLILGNAIGTDISVSRAIGNGDAGILVDQGSTGVQIGGVGPGTTNFVSGNGVVGIVIQGQSTLNVVVGNLIGTNLEGTAAIGNGIAGVLISDASNNFVGFGNLISGNGTASQGAGIWIDGPGSANNQIAGNRIGTDLTGESAIPNAIIGILINESSDNLIGGTAPGDLNLISGNSQIGVMIAGEGSTGNLLAGNLIGTDALGQKAISNGTGVYLDDAPLNSIGNNEPNTGNVISGNSSDGIQIFGVDSYSNVLQANRIGTDLTGTRPLGNGGNGILINDAPGTRIVGDLVDSSGQDGIFVSGSASTATLIQASLIGRGITGEALGNADFGLLIGNDAPMPTQVGNLNLNNTLGPIRDTSLTPSTTLPSSKTAQVNSNSKKVAVKVQVKSESFGDRPLTALQSRGRLKSTAKVRS